MSKHDVKGKVVLIAGGGKNLGGLLSRDFAAKGARLAIHYNSESRDPIFEMRAGGRNRNSTSLLIAMAISF